MRQAQALWLLALAALLQVFSLAFPCRERMGVFNSHVKTTLAIYPALSKQGPHQRHLLRELLRDYNPMERPVANDSHPLIVRFSFILMQVMDVDEKNQILTTNAWLQMHWYDHYLQWNQSEYPGVKNLRFSSDQVWTPDILMYNSAHDKFDASFKTNVLVNSSGFCEFLPPGIFISTCNVDVRWFPFDIQRCEMKFGSWTFDGWHLDMQMKAADISGYMPNGEWDLLEVPGTRNENYYDCCAAPYPDVTFVVTLRRRTLYYALNLLIPCVLLSAMTLLMFLLPASCGEKISLGITVLLSLTVFMLMVAEIMPATSDSVPLIGQYFVTTMVIVGMSVVATVIVLKFNHHDPNSGSMPQCVQLVLLQWVPWFLRMKRPGETAELPPPIPAHVSSQNKGLSSPTTTATTATTPNPAPTILPQTLGFLQARLAHLSHPGHVPAGHPAAHQAAPPPGAVQRDVSPGPQAPQPNGHLPYMGFQTFPVPVEPEPELGNRTVSHGRAAAGGGEAGGGRGGGGGGGGGASIGDTPPILHHHHSVPPGFEGSSQPAPMSPPFESSSSAAADTVIEVGGCEGGVAGAHGHGCAAQADCVDGQLQALLAEVRFIVEHLREQDRRLSVAEQWQFASAVIDRLCFIGFSVFNIICTIAIIMAAPNFVEAASKDFL